MSETEIVKLDDARLGLPSCSAFPRLFACDGAYQLEAVAAAQAVPVPDGSRDADRGTFLHSKVESGDITDLDENDAEIVTQVRETEERLVNDWLAETGSVMADVIVYRELRMYRQFGDGGDFSGQADTLVVNDQKKLAFVLDTKTGRKRIAPPVENQQLRGLAALVRLRFGSITVRTAIVQPFVQSHAVCDYQLEHLVALEGLIPARLKYIKTPDLPRTPGDWCSFCRARSVCPEMRAQMGVAIRSQSLNWDAVLPEQKAGLFMIAKMAIDAGTLLKEQLKADLKADPNCAPGLTLTKETHPRKIVDVRAVAWKILGEFPDRGPTHGGLDEDNPVWDFLEHTSMSISDFQAFFKTCAGGSKVAADKFLEECAANGFVETKTRSGHLDIVGEK